VSRLLKQVREKRGLAYSAASYFAFQQVAGTFVASLQTRNDQTAQALEVAQGVLKDFVENGATEAELKAAKQHLIGGFPMKIDSNREILEYLAMIGFYRMPLDHLQNFTKKIDAVTLEQIKTAYQKRFHLDKFITLTVGNEESKAAVKSEVEKSGK
jgi:zinc protease